MPGLNGTGPMGSGPMTGGQRGLCNPANTPYRTGNALNYGRGLSMGCRFRGGRHGGTGYGFGWGRGFARQPQRVPYFVQGNRDEISMLKDQANSMRDALDEINQRIELLTGNSEKSDKQGVVDD